MEVKPSLAESWKPPDPTTYIFHLRKGVTWHNGREFMASDVAYWYVADDGPRDRGDPAR